MCLGHIPEVAALFFLGGGVRNFRGVDLEERRRVKGKETVVTMKQCMREEEKLKKL